MSDNILTSKQDANQVLRLAFDDATQALRTTGSAATTVTVIQPDGALLHTTVDASALPTGASTAAKQDTGNTSLSSIDTKTPALVSGRVPVDGSGVTQPVSASSLPLPTGAATAANQSTANASLSSIDTKLTSPLAVTGPLTDTQLRASPVPVSMASSPLPAGAATAANQTTQITHESNTATSVASIDIKTPALGQALAGSSVPVVLTAAQIATLTPLTTVAVTQATGTNLHTVVDSSALPSGAATSALQTTGNTSLSSIDTKTPALVTGRVPVDGSGVTQPVSGTVTVTQATGTNLHTVVDSGTVAATQSGTWNITNVSGTVSLPTGAATETTLSAVSGKLPATLGQKTSANSLAVVLSSDQSALTVTSSVAGKTVSTLPTYTDYSSTPVTTAAYTQLVASTSAAITHLSIFDSSGQAMILSTGAAASEVIKLYIQPGGGEYDLAIPSGTRIVIKALTANATSGYQLLNMLT